MERTLILLKPDAVQRNLLGEIIHRFERKGLKIVGMKMLCLGDALLDEHYAHHKDKSWFDDVKRYMKKFSGCGARSRRRERHQRRPFDRWQQRKGTKRMPGVFAAILG